MGNSCTDNVVAAADGEGLSRVSQFGGVRSEGRGVKGVKLDRSQLRRENDGLTMPWPA